VSTVPEGERRDRAVRPTASADGEASAAAVIASGYVNDEPWGPQAEERLGRRGFAQRIATTIAARHETAGLVIALYGAWGEGKTSVLRMVKQDLTDAGDVVVVDFNPWRFRDADHLVEMFFNTLAQKLGDAVRLRTKSEAVGTALRRYGKILKGVPVPYVGSALADAAEAIGDRIGEPELEAIRSRVEAGIREAGVRLVVFIDDMDRLDGAEIRAVVRMVKLTAGFERTTYVLAFDPDVVAAALATAVGAVAPADGRRYLEKIVQVPLQLPAADQTTLFVLTLEHLNAAIRDVDIDVPEADKQAYARYVEPLFRARPRTIREGKRYANAAGFVLPLVAHEVNVADLLLLEAIRAWYPDVHGRLQAHRELLIGDALVRPMTARGSDGKAAAEAALQELLAGLTAREQDAVRSALEHLFPLLQSLTRNTIYNDPYWFAAWDRGQRAASRNYFDRYFQYNVPRGDVADRRVGDISAALGTGDVAMAVTLVRAEAAKGGAKRLIDKLSARMESLSPMAAMALVRTLAETGDLYLADGGFFGDWVSTVAGAARTLNHSLRRLPPSERTALAGEAVTTTPSTRFAVASYQWLRALGTERADGTATLTEAEEESVRVALGARLDAEHQAIPLYRSEPASDRRTLLAWWGIATSKAHTEADLTQRFQADASVVSEFLLPFRSHGWSLESGLPTPDMLEHNDYDSVAALIDPAMVLTTLEVVYGRHLGEGDPYTQPSFTTAAEAAAHQFARLHRRAIARANQAANATEGAGADEDGLPEG
jgi:KAP family P-loop domain